MKKIGKSILQGAAEALSYAKGKKKGARTHKIETNDVVTTKIIKRNLIPQMNQY